MGSSMFKILPFLVVIPLFAFSIKTVDETSEAKRKAELAKIRESMNEIADDGKIIYKSHVKTLNSVRKTIQAEKLPIYQVVNKKGKSKKVIAQKRANIEAEIKAKFEAKQKLLKAKKKKESINAEKESADFFESINSSDTKAIDIEK